MYVQAGLSLCWSHIPHFRKSRVTAHLCICAKAYADVSREAGCQNVCLCFTTIDFHGEN